jgi:serine/threonine-protein kinase
MTEEGPRIDAGEAGQGIAALGAALADRYVVERELGKGGMATVYLARDLRHDRLVALKVLLSELGALLGTERFLNEIRVTAGLQHPHVLPLFDSGEAAGQLYYTMPYVAGESLRARLQRERHLPVDEAVQIVVAVAGALDYAHRKGVVHRDLKPENILLHDGQPVVADFGIALAVQRAGGERMTQTGLSLGTPQYMAPEQATGERGVDGRADLYALGVVLYEMLAGEPPFGGPTAQAIVTKAMTEAPPPLSTRRRSVPPNVEAAVGRALEKLPADRFPGVAAFADALSTPVGPRVADVPRLATAGTPLTRFVNQHLRLVALVVAGAFVAVAVLGWLVGRASLGRAGQTTALQPVRFVIEPDSGDLGSGNLEDSAPAISPDGRTVVFAATGPGGSHLYARRVDDLRARRLPGTEGGHRPFFSPDGDWVGFESRGAIRKVRLTGGSPVVVAEVPASDGIFVGGSWGPDDTIFYSVFYSGALYRVSAGGGQPTRVTLADTTRYTLHPYPLPGGRALLVTSTRDWRVGRLGVLDLASGEVRQFGAGAGARYVAGNIIYAGASGALYKQPFDLDRLAPAGPAEEIASGLDVWRAAYSPFDVSSSGALVYRASGDELKLAVTDRAGRIQKTLPGVFPAAPRISPDGRRVAYSALPPDQGRADAWSGEVWRKDIWVTDLASGTTEPATTDGHNNTENNEPQWSPDGTSIAFDARLPGKTTEIYVKTLGRDSSRLISHLPHTRRPRELVLSDWVPNGDAVLFEAIFDAFRDGDIWIQPLDGGGARRYLTGPNVPRAARVSRDGRWVAYESSETGRAEVYLQPYPQLGQKTLVSNGGGVRPAWRRDGRELYYWQEDELIAASLEFPKNDGPPVVRARALFRLPHVDDAGYDVTPDGNQFVIVSGGPGANRLVVALDALSPGRSPDRER